MKIAIASSGLEHVKRGIEAWADDTALALSRKGVDVTLFKGSGVKRRPYEVVLPCFKRGSFGARLLSRACRHYLWRFGLASEYGVEQVTFALSLINRLRGFDLLHTQDPQLAWVIEKARRLGWVDAKLVLAHGTEEPLEYLNRFEWVQELAPVYLQEDREQGIAKPWFAIPNFVDTQRFQPEGRLDAKGELGIPEDTFVVLMVCAVKRVHKRVDWAIQEFRNFLDERPHLKTRLLIAGAQENDTPYLMELGTSLLRGKVEFLINYPREKIAGLYRAADVFLHASFHEMMPIALLEALASGLPVLANRAPIFQWIVGEGGDLIDVSQEGEGCRALLRYLDKSHRQDKSRLAREQAVKNFSSEVVISKICQMYGEVLSHENKETKRFADEGVAVRCLP